ncbi:hypothetical protein SK128_025053 [Halocaridina rubra]|uniref:Ionotropic glutamate receptor L-glutamate and glycine-binding domain-containing protein n=1 Tax=Halocaridina rubra TaxID=373956 RepID=A0AAN8X8V4_HALRR
MDYTPDTNLPGTKITLKDCLDKRILTTVAAYLNFTYIIREPEDGEWGLDQDGNWTGIVGELQHNKADFSLLLGLVYSRAQVMDFSSIYSNDRWVIISLKNQPLPKSQALVTPFTGPVWIGVIIATLVAGVALWLLNSVWRTLLNVPGMSLSLAMLYTWGALVCIPASNPPNRFNIRMLICWLWIFTFIVSSAYKSSLIAHLTIPTFPPPINSFEDLVHSSGITWGSEPLYGTEVIFFNSSLDPAMREFYSKLQFGTLEEHMTKVMEGKHAFFNSKWYIKHVIASQYTNTLGYTPLHFSQHQYPTSAGSVWGVRRGGIFNYAITRTRVRLTEVGLFAFWMDDVINTRAKQVRRELKEKGGGINFQNIGAETMNANTQEVLSLNHLQGAFYILFAGTLLAFTILLLEIGITCLTKEMHV